MQPHHSKTAENLRQRENLKIKQMKKKIIFKHAIVKLMADFSVGTN